MVLARPTYATAPLLANRVKPETEQVPQSIKNAWLGGNGSSSVRLDLTMITPANSGSYTATVPLTPPTIAVSSFQGSKFPWSTT